MQEHRVESDGKTIGKDTLPAFHPYNHTVALYILSNLARTVAPQ